MPKNSIDHDVVSDASGSGTRRRSFMKLAGAAGTGALGALAGCSSNGSNGGGGDNGGGGSNGSNAQSNSGNGGSQESVSISFWSAIAAETPSLKNYFSKGMTQFEKIHDQKIKVDMQVLSHDDLKKKYATTVDAGSGIPDVAMSGSFGLEQFQNGNVIDHGPYIEETDGLPDNWAKAQKESGKYRGKWWAAGAPAVGSTQWCLKTDAFKAAGVSGPEDLETWTDMRRTLDKIKQKGDVKYAYEVTGVYNDVEAYWGNAHTAYTDGTDPWFDTDDKGSPNKPYIRVNHADRTNGMMLNEYDLGKAYSSPGYPSTGDEDTYPKILNGTIASQAYSCSIRSFTSLNPDVKFGWDGDVLGLTAPKLDANYGDEFNIPSLAGKKGMPGGHTWTLETQVTIQDASKNKDAAWELSKFRLIDERFLLPLLIDPDLNQSAAAYKPVLKKQQSSKYSKYRVQPFNVALEQLAKYGVNYTTTGAAWDFPGTDAVRWNAIGKTLSKGYAGQFPRKQIPAKVESAIRSVLKDNNVTPAN